MENSKYRGNYDLRLEVYSGSRVYRLLNGDIRTLVARECTQGEHDKTGLA